ncbi:MAG TPA: urease accessory protein UreH [Candidatus Methylomirabilis sp.]|nr:urease accessory protein UreH [Candidatus Methylomirabilis sp.]HSB77866.1 urease accessory protein UreH [Candidatus Methylomirabilis sp.]HSC69801.1 urease accessory protein UreH [Candidatus Methylomirabilis sp.]
MDNSLTAALGLGLLLGVRHATDADHVAAVSTLVCQHRSLARSCILGACWGAGHTLALLAAGIAVISFKLTISREIEQGLETLVAFVLILLGGHVLLRSVGAWTLHRHEHFHDGHAHSHLHLHIGGADSPGHVHLLRLGGRPFLVGLLHGMAGSAALMLLVLTTIPSPLGGLLYILVFGVGSTAGMLVLSGLIGIPLLLSARRSHTVHVGIQALAGAASLILGLALVLEFVKIA